jgi:hypothetical protein
MTNAEKWISAAMNAIDIPLASPFAVATIINQLPPGTLQVIDNTMRNVQNAGRQSERDRP